MPYSNKVYVIIMYVILRASPNLKYLFVHYKQVLVQYFNPYLKAQAFS